MLFSDTDSISQSNTDVNTFKKNILSDVDSRGRERPWRKHKLESQHLSSWCIDEIESKNEILSVQNTYYFEQCGDWLLFNRYKDKSLKLKKSNFCKLRVCPMCNWRRSLKLWSQTKRMIETIDDAFNNEFNYLFLTLTLKNCYADELEKTIDNINYAFNKFTKKVAIKKILMGYMKAVEITYNKKDKSFHPHLHCIIQVPANYFKNYKYADRDRIYLTHADFRKIWRECLKVNYDPLVNIKKIEDCDAKAIAEVSKYPTKINGLFKLDDEEGKEVLRTFYNATHGKRLVSFGGIFKEVRAWLKMKDIEADDDLVNINDDESKNADDEAVEEMYFWRFGFYVR